MIEDIAVAFIESTLFFISGLVLVVSGAMIYSLLRGK